MSNILNDLNAEEENLNWWHLSACQGMDTNLFFDKYELDPKIAANVDQCCLSCPVMAMCYQAGVENNEYGVWGGIYLNAGGVDRMRNTHKTKDIWKQVNKKNGI